MIMIMITTVDKGERISYKYKDNKKLFTTTDYQGYIIQTKITAFEAEQLSTLHFTVYRRWINIDKQFL